ncbi:PREDICTED: ethylene-responsive transcription factor 3-like [Ipomoea nil]|uniref:ethylene-responsive transcription factor 3-like n=1 Tax=Ipomoea nil TaxID=35883 RepID=UPI000900D36D|nr:PREDICTED: ethylene-responsive transcription factor 3-like [Ipomoea nil]
MSMPSSMPTPASPSGTSPPSSASFATRNVARLQHLPPPLFRFPFPPLLAPISRCNRSLKESFSGPRPPRPQTTTPPAIPSRHHPRSSPVVPDDCHSDCDSSSSVVEDGDYENFVSSSFRKPLPFDLNMPSPIDGVDAEANDLHCTALCL